MMLKIMMKKRPIFILVFIINCLTSGKALSGDINLISNSDSVGNSVDYNVSTNPFIPPTLPLLPSPTLSPLPSPINPKNLVVYPTKKEKAAAGTILALAAIGGATVATGVIAGLVLGIRAAYQKVMHKRAKERLDKAMAILIDPNFLQAIKVDDENSSDEQISYKAAVVVVWLVAQEGESSSYNLTSSDPAIIAKNINLINAGISDAYVPFKLLNSGQQKIIYDLTKQGVSWKSLSKKMEIFLLNNAGQG